MGARVGNAVPGVPSGAVRKHRARYVYQTAAFGGRNAGDGVPYACILGGGKKC
ncbi:MAG: hypothetical protein IJA49_06155 [Oscillospiraceae bacterium]|nr:hypothetical protein [Oscillospiraceae bacterium]